MGPVILIAIWAAHFTLAYGFTAFACARAMPGVIPWVVGAASAVALVALAALAVPAAIRAARNPALGDVLTSGLGGLAAIAVVWEASSLLGVRACA
jgi:hypothetical protein